MLTDRIPPRLYADAAAVIAADPVLQEWLEMDSAAWSSFVPRPDRPELFDEQHSFCYNQDPVSFLIGGNAAGTTEAAAFKTAQFVLNWQPPPRPNTPFWIISNTYEQVCAVCWDEKLYGHAHIPKCEVDWDNVSYLNRSKNWPSSVPLKPWPADRPGAKPGCNWVLEFKSYEQGRRALQARSIGGFWFSEQFPQDLFLETLRGCREYMFPGGQFAEFTPIEPELCLWVEKCMEENHPGWRFYRANTEENRVNLADGWYENFFAGVPEEMMATRKTGQLASFEGVIFQAFAPAFHVREDLFMFPPGVEYYRAVDWGASEEHPFAGVWGYRDGTGMWFVFDEYWNNSQSAITWDHVEAIHRRSAGWGWPQMEEAIEKNHPRLYRLFAEIYPHPREKVYVERGNPYYRDTYADPSRPGELNEFNYSGIPTFPAANDVFKGIDCIRSLLKPRANGLPGLVIHPRCRHLIEEMRKYRWLKGKKPSDGNILNPKVATAMPLKRDDDTVDALRYMIYSAERGRGAVPGSMSHREFVESRRSVQLGSDGVYRPGRSMRGVFTRG